MKLWCLQLICCGRDDGTVKFETWDEADGFRDQYTSGPGVNEPGGHERAAILRRAPGFRPTAVPAAFLKAFGDHNPAGEDTAP